MIFRTSQKLAKKLHLGELPELAPDESPHADWSCHLFTADRRQYILVANTASLYSCVLLGRGITSDDRFIKDVASHLRTVLEEDGLSFMFHRLIAPNTGTIHFAKALDRSVISSLNELVGQAILEGWEASPHFVNHCLNDTLLSRIAPEGDHGYGKPREAFRRLRAV
jgi:hypothetical protein